MYKAENLITNLKCARVNKLIIYLIMRKKKAPIYKLSCSRAPKTLQICNYKHVRKTRVLFSLFNTGVDLRFRNNFANSGSCSKSFRTCRIYNCLSKQTFSVIYFVTNQSMPSMCTSLQWMVSCNSLCIVTGDQTAKVKCLYSIYNYLHLMLILICSHELLLEKSLYLTRLKDKVVYKTCSLNC